MTKRGSAHDPLWYKDAIIYETHVKAFFDSRNNGSGDFGGLIQKLDYLQDLGVTCLWLLPFFPSPMRDDGYDIADYTSVHPSYGTIEEFKTFLDAAHQRNLQVMIELVVNHTSDQHPWFQAARKAPPGSPERDYYVWSDTDRMYGDARIIFTDTEKSNWTWDPEAKAYYWHRFFSHQPDLNFDNPAVLKDVLKVMHFWLDLGVDGLRLDAIPYLVEREGTSCENLPETHAVVKQIRGDLDAHYTNRVLLAEANQWPSDVAAYFGDADECHMTFHFPIMPRMFMALRLEDRHPITEIMAQTPDIHDACQWALFLRNHDELTLEMVTDEERDYMYLAYSSDQRMKLNLGIRRRLAPLVDNNRRRIELLNSLLLSFPGTPIVYYGDEIGMGDNIYLGDRNGVRTPMQWSADRNGGFSRANPAQLYSPVILDPVYGYEAVNVEAQQSDPSSLLHWMKNMIALRKLFPVFGRGKMEFLHPANRKVLAYIRRYQGDQILCVANLSRFAQPVELDLHGLAGSVPVEMLGYNEFPPIGNSPYPLTLGPYGFYWFELQPAPAPVEIRGAEEVTEVVLEMSGGWDDLFASHGKARLEAKVLPEFLPAQRWFGGKARKIQSVRVRDWAALTGPPALSALLLIQVEYTAGAAERYFIPLSVALGEEAEKLHSEHPEWVLCAATYRGESGVLFDATADPAACQALLAAMQDERELAARDGTVRAFHTGVFKEVRGTDSKLQAVRSSAEQSNTSVLFADRMILKLFRRAEEGTNPDLEIGLYLTEKARFGHVPRLAGAIEYRAEGSQPTTLAVLQELVANQGDGWKWTQEELGRCYEQCAAQPPSRDLPMAESGSLVELAETDVPRAAQERLGIYLHAAETLGRRTAALHLALAHGSEDQAFDPEPLTAADVSVLANDLRAHATKVFDALKESLSRLPDEVVEVASLALSRRRMLVDSFRQLENAGDGGAKIRIHGDYHLGQVLRVESDWVILDFEGEPARPLAERRAKQSPLKDVAGMLRSFSYAAHSALLAYASRRPEHLPRLEGWANLWEQWTSAVFLKAYRAEAGEAAFLPGDPARFQQLLDAFLLDKALYELNYELNNRPAWVRIPLHGILRIAEGRQTAGEHRIHGAPSRLTD